jgi:hypothetical protein
MMLTEAHVFHRGTGISVKERKHEDAKKRTGEMTAEKRTFSVVRK